MTLLAHVEGSRSVLALWTHWVHEPASVLSLAAVASAYVCGVRAVWARAGRGRGIGRRQVVCFGAGVGILALALMSPIDALADDLFSAHMLQHVLLAVAAPPLLVAGEPVLAVMWTLSPERRRSVVRWLRQRRAITAAWRLLTAPRLAWAIHAAVLWLWHVPALYRSALDVPFLHALEHVSFVGTASLIWWGILHPASQRSRRVSYGIGVVVLFATMLQSGALGALITLSHRVWYPFQSAGAAAWGITPLDDQQVAGLIMWVGGGLLQLVLVNVLVFTWMRENERYGRLARAATVAATLVAAGCARAEGSAVPGASASRGRQTLVAMGCGSCHTIPGIREARGRVGPSLAGIGARSIIAGHLPNTPDNMVRWIMDPPAINPQTAMPKLGVTAASARDIVAYLYTLR
jgi:cytochrome c oxidase assembly factor CtaG